MSIIVDPTGDGQTPKDFPSLRKAWASGYSTGVLDEKYHRDDPKFMTPNDWAADDAAGNVSVTYLLDELHDMRQGIGELIGRMTETGEWEHDGGCEGGDPNCMACTVADLRALVGVGTFDQNHCAACEDDSPCGDSWGPVVKVLRDKADELFDPILKPEVDQ